MATTEPEYSTQEDINNGPPRKKRRFFAETPTPSPSPESEENNDIRNDDVANRDAHQVPFDSELLTAVVGEELSPETLANLRKASGNDLQSGKNYTSSICNIAILSKMIAINLYLDGSWKSKPTEGASVMQTDNPTAAPQVSSDALTSGNDYSTVPIEDIPTKPKYDIMPDKRYVGAFGVTAWSTRSGPALVRYGERVRIERAQPQNNTFKRGKGRLQQSKRQDIVVRFTTSRNEEVGRLENEAAAWISTLIDQKICRFDGHCVFSPDRVRTNDTIYLQLRCYLLRSAFMGSGFTKSDDNRETGLFEVKETQEERNLRLRQVAMVKLFDEINLQPSRQNETTAMHKKQGLLKAAEKAEQKDPGSSPPNSRPDSSDEAEEGEELEQDQLDTLYEKAQSFDFNTPEAEPAPTFAMQLRKYQKQALFWMMGKEKDEKLDHKELSMHPLWEEYNWPTKDVDDKPLPDVADQTSFYVNPYSGEMSLDFPVQEQNCLGGILADEMGLGKTIEMLSLIHSHRPEITVPQGNVNGLPRLLKFSNSVEPAPATTLVVAPMSLLAQWQSEAEKASKAGTLKILMYYGTEKNVNLRALCCAANAASAPNVVITSYGVVLSEYNQIAANGGNRGAHDGLFSVEYFRVILDEAHTIKNRQAKTSKACYKINATHRWVLTGTPIVNRLEDLFSLVHFLRVEPWSNFSFWKTFITVPFESKDFIRALDVVQTVLEPLVMRRTKDMKTPDGEPLVPLPPRNIIVEKLEMSKAEREVYDHIFMRAKRTFNANVEAGTLMKSYTTIFAQILRLRQSCCHPVLTRNAIILSEEEDAAAAADATNGLADDMDLQELIDRFTSEEGTQDANKYGAHVLKQIQDEAETECPICSEEPMNEQAVTGCWHSACKQCLLDYIEHYRNKGEIAKCFNCREPINARDIFEVIRHDTEYKDKSNEFYSSTTSNGSSKSDISLRRVGCNASAKISALITSLKQLRRAEPLLKSVVFSQFTSFLDLIEPALVRDRIPYLRFDGTMSQKQRAAVLTDFTSRPKGVILLLSLRAGGVGLNLTCARQVFMMDPWWSFAIEAQAIDRVHRMGQENSVNVVRFIVQGSIEEKMLRIQERKKFM
jgi:DNA repair protein RAD5